MGERVRRATAGAAVASLGLLVLGGCVFGSPTPVDAAREAPADADLWKFIAHELAPVPVAAPVALPAVQAASVSESGRPFPEHPAQPESSAIDCRVVRCVALTFDDGPSVHTARLLEYLASESVPATFFELGDMVRQTPSLAKAAAARGEVGSHTWDHKDLRRLTDTQVSWDLQQTEAVLTAAVGTRPYLFRPPYGATNQHVADVVRQAGLPIVLWSVDPEDWRVRNADIVHQRVMDDVRPGSVVLLHDTWGSTVDAVPRIVADLRAAGYTFVTVSQMWDGNLHAGATYTGRERDWQGAAVEQPREVADEPRRVAKRPRAAAKRPDLAPRSGEAAAAAPAPEWPPFD